jgi:hypothetical protein
MTCDVALAAARQHGLSAALFAPGWVYENHSRAQWQALQGAFWGKVEAAWPPAQPSIASLPLHTSFNRGCGRHMHVAGSRVAGSRPWYQLGAQQLLPGEEALRRSWAMPLQQPAAEGAADGAAASSSGGGGGSKLSAELTDEVAYEGGSCLQLSCSSGGRGRAHQAVAELACCRLFDAGVCCSSGRLRVTCVAGGQHAAQLVLLLHTAGEAASDGGGGGGAQLLLLAPAASHGQLQQLQGRRSEAEGEAAQIRVSVVAAASVSDAAAGGHTQLLLQQQGQQGQQQGGQQGQQQQGQQQGPAGPWPWQRHCYAVDLPAGARMVTGCSVGLLLAAPEGGGSTGPCCTALLGERGCRGGLHCRPAAQQRGGRHLDASRS